MNETLIKIRNMRKKEYKVTIATSIPVAIVTKLDELAAKAGLSKSSYVCAVLEDHVNTMQKDELKEPSCA
jgi:predicted DNA-binding protein